jgi:hypothetical protein
MPPPGRRPLSPLFAVAGGGFVAAAALTLENEPTTEQVGLTLIGAAGCAYIVRRDSTILRRPELILAGALSISTVGLICRDDIVNVRENRQKVDTFTRLDVVKMTRPTTGNAPLATLAILQGKGCANAAIAADDSAAFDVPVGCDDNGHAIHGPARLYVQPSDTAPTTGQCTLRAWPIADRTPPVTLIVAPTICALRVVPHP